MAGKTRRLSVAFLATVANQYVDRLSAGASAEEAVRYLVGKFGRTPRTLSYWLRLAVSNGLMTGPTGHERMTAKGLKQIQANNRMAGR